MVNFRFERLRHRPPDSDQPALDVERLEMSYAGGAPVLANISFAVAPGERVALMGPNGAGKSTLFKAIVGLLPIGRGHIRIHGADCHSSHSFVGYVPQQNAIDWSFPASVFDVVMMGRSRHIGWLRRPRKSDRAIVYDLLEHLGMQDFAQRQISELSGGQRRRVFIARAMAQDARVLLMDEPFNGLDQTAEQELIDALDILTQHGITILISTHHIENAALHFDKALILKTRLLAFGKPAAVMTPENLKNAYGRTLPMFAHSGELLMFSSHTNGSAR